MFPLTVQKNTHILQLYLRLDKPWDILPHRTPNVNKVEQRLITKIV